MPSKDTMELYKANSKSSKVNRTRSRRTQWLDVEMFSGAEFSTDRKRGLPYQLCIRAKIIV